MTGRAAAVDRRLARSRSPRSTASSSRVNRRLEIVRRLHDHKQANGIPLRDPGREDAMLALLAGENRGPLSEQGVAEFYTLRARPDAAGAPWRVAAGSSACPATGSGPR